MIHKPLGGYLPGNIVLTNQATFKRIQASTAADIGAQLHIGLISILFIFPRAVGVAGLYGDGIGVGGIGAPAYPLFGYHLDDSPLNANDII